MKALVVLLMILVASPAFAERTCVVFKADGTHGGELIDTGKNIKELKIWGYEFKVEFWLGDDGVFGRMLTHITGPDDFNMGGNSSWNRGYVELNFRDPKTGDWIRLKCVPY